MADSAFRIEQDSMGEMQVPDWALWGASTQRAVQNFPSRVRCAINPLPRSARCRQVRPHGGDAVGVVPEGDASFQISCNGLRITIFARFAFSVVQPQCLGLHYSRVRRRSIPLGHQPS
jgi:hypothetical protein